MNLRDLMGNAPLTSAARAAMSVADALQSESDKGAQLLGLGAAFLLASEAAGLPVTDLMTYTRNCMNHADGKRPEFAAVAEYIQREVFGHA